MKCEHGITPWWDCDPCRTSSKFGEDPLEPYFDGELDAYVTTRAGRRAIMAQKKLEYHDVSKKLRGKVYVDMGR
jgi:hypothetical protein